EPSEPLVERAEPGQPYGFDVQLKFAARLEDRRRGANLDLQPVAQLDVQRLHLVLVDDALGLRLRILEDEVAVSRRCARPVGGFAADPAQAQVALDQKAGRADEQRYGKNGSSGSHEVVLGSSNRR